tara:strand:- start:2119 stop:2259 length:141 start_codon:yes stop_codon:yes gene_type:complete
MVNKDYQTKENLGVCSRCGKTGCKCDPETCKCEPVPQKDLVQDFEE